jgi:hypothetical protein
LHQYTPISNSMWNVFITGCSPIILQYNDDKLNIAFATSDHQCDEYLCSASMHTESPKSASSIPDHNSDTLLPSRLLDGCSEVHDALDALARLIPQYADHDDTYNEPLNPSCSPVDHQQTADLDLAFMTEIPSSKPSSPRSIAAPASSDAIDSTDDGRRVLTSLCAPSSSPPSSSPPLFTSSPMASSQTSAVSAQSLPLKDHSATMENERKTQITSLTGPQQENVIKPMGAPLLYDVHVCIAILGLQFLILYDHRIFLLHKLTTSKSTDGPVAVLSAMMKLSCLE